MNFGMDDRSSRDMLRNQRQRGHRQAIEQDNSSSRGQIQETKVRPCIIINGAKEVNVDVGDVKV